MPVLRERMANSFDEIFGQDAAVESLKEAYRADRMPHALIFAGPVGVGKGTTAAAVGKLWLCEKPNTKSAEPCGTCDSCRTFDVGTHPDFQRQGLGKAVMAEGLRVEALYERIPALVRILLACRLQGTTRVRHRLLAVSGPCGVLRLVAA